MATPAAMIVPLAKGLSKETIVSCNRIILEQVVQVVKDFHKSLISDKQKRKDFCVSILKELYSDYKTYSGIACATNLIVDIIKELCNAIGACDTKQREAFYLLWLKVVYDLNVSAGDEKVMLDNIQKYFDGLLETYSFKVVFEIADEINRMGRYYYECELTAVGDNLEMRAHIQDIQSEYWDNADELMTFDVSRQKLVEFARCLVENYGSYGLIDELTMPIQLSLVPRGGDKKYLALSQYLQHKEILDAIVAKSGVMSGLRNAMCLR